MPRKAKRPLRLEWVEAGSLADNPRNWRRHPAGQMGALKAVLEDDQIGWAGALLYNERTERLIDGHARKEAVDAKAVVPVLVGSWSEAAERKILLTLDPLAGMAVPDAAALNALMANVDLEATELAGVAELLAQQVKLAEAAESRAREVVEDEVPEPQANPVTKPGDLWTLGEHRVLCGDATPQEADVLLTDPPYGIDAPNMTLGTGKKGFVARGNWDKERPNVRPFISGRSIVWGGNYFADVLPVSPDWLCWHKKNDGLSFGECELAWSNIGRGCRHLSHHWSGEMKAHPTQKPVAVMAWCIGLGDWETIADPFLGSGTTLIAAEQLGRRCYGIEIEPKYVDVVCRRWHKLTGKVPMRANGRKFPRARLES